jgi:GNAT superfamily N-acetyltransferase
VRVDTLPRSGAARAIADEAEEILGGAGLHHRRVLADRHDQGQDLSAGLASLGWKTEVHVVMEWPGGRPGPAPRARLVDAHQGRAAFAATTEGPEYDDEIRRQLIAHWTYAPTEGPRLRRVAASHEPGGPVRSLCNLFDDGRTAEIDNVTTAPDAQRQGLAGEVVRHALALALDEGCDLVFLRADERDWPVEWYRRLGFRPIGRQYVFSKT